MPRGFPNPAGWVKLRRVIPLPTIIAGFLGFIVLLTLSPSALGEGLLQQLRKEAPDASARVLALALEARDCAAATGATPPSPRLAVIDYSKPSTEPRLWVFDLQSGPRLLYTEHVAHGRGSGGDRASSFSNVEGSHQSSLGLFLTAETYQGGNGYSLRLDGLESGVNDRARERYIVMHGAWYVDPELAERQGRLGRSFGCPAVRDEVAEEVIDTLRDGQLLFAYYPDPEWLSSSPFLGCGANVVARNGGAGTKAGISP